MSQKPAVLIYSKDPCPYCDRAKVFLKNREIPYEEIDLTGKPEEIQALKQRTGFPTVPQIFIHGELIGGYTDLKALDDEGKLESLLNKA